MEHPQITNTHSTEVLEQLRSTPEYRDYISRKDHNEVIEELRDEIAPRLKRLFWLTILASVLHGVFVYGAIALFPFSASDFMLFFQCSVLAVVLIKVVRSWIDTSDVIVQLYYAFQKVNTAKTTLDLSIGYSMVDAGILEAANMLHFATNLNAAAIALLDLANTQPSCLVYSGKYIQVTPSQFTEHEVCGVVGGENIYTSIKLHFADGTEMTYNFDRVEQNVNLGSARTMVYETEGIIGRLHQNEKTPGFGTAILYRRVP